MNAHDLGGTMPSKRRPWVRVVPFVLACSLVARAEPTPEARALARSLFDEGRALGKDGRFAEACPKLEESERLDPGLGTGYNLADCYEHVGRTASAWSLFGEVADAARQAGQAERERVARARAVALEPKLARLIVRAPPDVVVTVDARPVGGGALGSAMPVDPGEHRIEATAPSKKPRALTVRVFEANTTSADIPPLDDEPAPAPAPVEAPPPALANPSPAPSPHGLGATKTAAIGAAAVGVVAIGVGAFFGLRARSKWSDAEPHCPSGACDAVGYPEWSEAHSNATAATVSFVVAGVGVAAAVVLWLVDGARAPATHGALTPVTTWRF
jgi:hypothetical protein